MDNQKYPTISILTITYNPDPHVFKQVLESIRNQDYPKNKIEHIVADGGSKKVIINLARKYNCSILVRKDLRNQSEARRAFALKKAKKEIILWLEADNTLPYPNSLKELIQPFIDVPDIISTFTLHYGHNKRMSLLDRYCAFLGGSDPVVFYLNKADRETWLMDKYTKGKIISRGKRYDVVEFNQGNLPTVGDNGFLTRRKILLKANVSPQKYLHIDIYVDLLKLGYNRFGVVKSTTIEHDIGKGLLSLLRRRVLYVKRYSFKYLQSRRYSVFDINSKSDIKNLLKYIFFTITLVQPISMSIKGYIRVKDLAWFLHPLACWLFLIYYVRFMSIELLALKFRKT